MQVLAKSAHGWRPVKKRDAPALVEKIVEQEERDVQEGCATVKEQENEPISTSEYGVEMVDMWRVLRPSVT